MKQYTNAYVKKIREIFSTIEGIEATSTDKVTNAKVYNLKGQLLNEQGSTQKLNKGVYILGDKKVQIN